MMTFAEVAKEDGEQYKFIVVKDEFRFIGHSGRSSQHRDMVKSDETAQGAGVILLDRQNKTWELQCDYSIGLSIGCPAEQKTALRMAMASIGLIETPAKKI